MDTTLQNALAWRRRLVRDRERLCPCLEAKKCLERRLRVLGALERVELAILRQLGWA